MDTKFEFEPKNLMGLSWQFSCFIGGLLVCVHLGTFEDEGFFIALFGGYMMAGVIGVLSMIAAGVYLKVEQYCEREELSDTARGLVVFSCFSMIVILLTFLFSRWGQH